MSTKKRTGAYYTPDYLARFIFNNLANYLPGNDKISILEPSVGDGSFVRAFNNTVFPESVKSFEFTGIDLIESELLKAQALANSHSKINTSYVFKSIDFLDEQATLKAGYQLIVGNPPYISKNLLEKHQIAHCEKIHSDAGLSQPTVKNIWAAFLIRCCSLLADNGILSFILPSELLQVKFSDEIRKYLNTVFERVEIFTFNDLLFECKGQDIVLLTGFKKHGSPGHFYTHILDVNDLTTQNYELVKNEALARHNTKWSHHTLASSELEFIYNIASRLSAINEYCDSKPGIVTAANSFFIVNESTETKYNLAAFTKPIIQKGLFVNGSIVFNERDFIKLNSSDKPSKILVFDDSTDVIHESVKEYLKIGEDLEINLRYKCKKRNTWYQIPNISSIPEGFFFKRTHFYPKLIKNAAQVFVTDSAYKIVMREGLKINDLIYSFYNSLTLLFAEIEGRYYGGGVLELTPSEFKKLPIPYVTIDDGAFAEFTNTFENKEDINEILALNDELILRQFMGLSVEEVQKIQLIYEKLVQKRFRKNGHERGGSEHQ